MYCACMVDSSSSSSYYCCLISLCLSSPRNNSRVVFNQHPRSYNVLSSFSRHKKSRHHSHHSRIVVTYHHAVKDDFIRGRRSCKEEAVGEGRVERTMRRHETRADHVARDLGTRLQLHFFPLVGLFFLCVYEKSHFLSLFSLRRLSIKKLSAGKTRRKKSPSSPPRSFLASTEAF